MLMVTENFSVAARPLLKKVSYLLPDKMVNAMAQSSGQLVSISSAISDYYLCFQTLASTSVSPNTCQPGLSSPALSLLKPDPDDVDSACWMPQRVIVWTPVMSFISARLQNLASAVSWPSNWGSPDS
jgi:hypothetical protein